MSPMAPKRPCSWPGCGALVDSGRCDVHRRKERREIDERRKDDPAHTFYSSAAWRAARAAHLSAEPLCREHRKRGQVVAADTVDHIVPMRKGGPPFDDSNLQSLCAPCHSAKSIKEGSRYGRG
jgi:5-methylcytosine-specific restriction protein A